MSDYIDHVYIRMDPQSEGVVNSDQRQVKTNDLATIRAHLAAARDDGFDVHRRNAVKEKVSAAVAASGRPKLVKLLRKLGPGTGLVVRTLDGLGRDAADILKTIRTVSESGAEVYCIAVSSDELTNRKEFLAALDFIAALDRRVADTREQTKKLGRGVAGGKAGRPHSLDDAERASVRVGLSNGETVSALAKRYNTSRQTILRVRDAGMQMDGNS